MATTPSFFGPRTRALILSGITAAALTLGIGTSPITVTPAPQATMVTASTPPRTSEYTNSNNLIARSGALNHGTPATSAPAAMGRVAALSKPAWIIPVVRALLSLATKGATRSKAFVTLKNGSRITKFGVAPASKLTNMLKHYKPLTYQAGSRKYILPKERMKHILERHHPAYWNGSGTTKQTFLDPKMSMNDVRALVGAALRQNQSKLKSLGANSRGSYTGKVSGIRYSITVQKGQVVQFYPY